MDFLIKPQSFLGGGVFPIPLSATDQGYHVDTNGDYYLKVSINGAEYFLPLQNSVPGVTPTITPTITPSISETPTTTPTISETPTGTPPPTETPTETPPETPTPTVTNTPTESTPIPIVLIDTGDAVIPLSNSSSYLIVDELINSFSLSINSRIITFDNYFDNNDQNNCYLQAQFSPEVSCEPSVIFLTDSAQLSTIDNDIYTFTYYNTGSVVLGYSLSSTQLPPPSPSPTQNVFFTPTPTRTLTPTPSPTKANITPTPTISITPSFSATATPTPTRTLTPTPTRTPRTSPTVSPTTSISPTPTNTTGITVTPTRTPTKTPTCTPTRSLPNPSNTPTTTNTPTVTKTPTKSSTPTPTKTPTVTPTSSVSPTINTTPTPTKTPTLSPVPVTPTVTRTPVNVVRIETNNEAISLTSNASNYIVVLDSINTFTFNIDNTHSISFQNVFDPNNIGNCYLIPLSSNTVYCDSNAIFVTQSANLSTNDGNNFTFYYYTTGSLLLGFSLSSAPLPDPTPTPSPNLAYSPTPSPTYTLTPTRTSSPTPTVSISNTNGVTQTPSPTVTRTPTLTRTPNITQTPSISITPSVSITPTLTPTISPSLTPNGPSQTPTSTPTVTPSKTPTSTPTLTNTPTNTITPSTTKTPSPTRTPTMTQTQTLSAIIVTATPTPTVTPSVTTSTSPASGGPVTLTPTRTPTKTPAATPPVSPGTQTPTPTITSSPSGAVVTATPTPTISPSMLINGVLFDKASFVGKVNEPYLTALNAAVDRWNTYVQIKPSVLASIRAYDPTFGGLRISTYTIADNGQNSFIASCGPASYFDLQTGGPGVQFCTYEFDLNVNTYFAPSAAPYNFTIQDWANVLTHELGHALGIGVFWNAALSAEGAVPPVNNFLSGAYSPLGPNYYTGTNFAYNKIIGSFRPLTPVEDTGGAGTAGAHWEDNFRPSSYVGAGGFSYPGLSNELMVGSYNPAINYVISNLSLSALIDFGYQEKNPGTNEGTPTVVSSLISSDLNIDTAAGNIVKYNCDKCERPAPVKLGIINLN